MLVGKWTVKQMRSDSFEGMNDEMRENMEKMLLEMNKTSYVEFKKNGEFDFLMAGINESGSWDFNPSDSTLNTNTKSKKKAAIKIIDLSDKNLTLSILPEKYDNPMICTFERK